MSRYWIWFWANFPVVAVFACAWYIYSHPQHKLFGLILAAVIAVFEVSAITVVTVKKPDL